MAIKSADQITIIDVTDAYSIILTSEAYTFVGGTTGAASGSTCSTQAVAYCGSTQCTTVHIGDITFSNTGITATVSNNDTATPTITFTTTAVVSDACEATIPVHVDGVIVNKKFSFAVAKTGVQGATGNAGRGISKVETFYLTTSAASGVTVSTSGWDTDPVATTTTNKYMWSYQKTTYTDNTTSNSTPAIIGTHGATGATGAAGADAITMTITSSAGTVFKNSSGSTILTAHVFVGGVEQTITAAGVCGSYGSVKWYKGNGTTAVATSKTYTVSATDVNNSLAITAQLE